MKDDPVVALLTVRHGPPMEELFDCAEFEKSAEVRVWYDKINDKFDILYILFTSPVAIYFSVVMR